MTVRRTDIRNAVANALKGKTGAGDRVFTSKYTALMAETYPLILIQNPEEGASAHSNVPRTYKRELKLLVSAVVEANEDLDDQLDTLSSEIEAVFGKDPTFGGLAMGSVLSDMDIVADGDVEQLYGALMMTFNVSYVA